MRPVIIFHKNTATCEFDLDTFKINCIYDKDHLPPILKGMPSKLEEWFNARMLASVKVKETKQINVRKQRILNSLAMNLSDCYWVDVPDTDKIWSKINLFDNNYKNLLPEIGSENDKAIVRPIDKINGWRDKGWGIDRYNGTRYLFKGSFDTRYGYSDNEREIIVMNIIDQLGLPVCKYNIYGKYVICRTESNSEYRELITAKDYYIEKFGNEDCILTELYKKLPQSIVDKINDMIIVDYIVNQKDRHYRNFGFLRDPRTLEILDLYPIYDNGGCFLYTEEPFYSRIIHQDESHTKDYLLQNSKLLYKSKVIKVLQNNIDNKEVLDKCIAKAENIL